MLRRVILCSIGVTNNVVYIDVNSNIGSDKQNAPTCRQHMLGFVFIHHQAYISRLTFDCVWKATAKYRLVRPIISISSAFTSSWKLLLNIVPVFARTLFRAKLKRSEAKRSVCLKFRTISKGLKRFLYLDGAADIA